MPNNNLLPGYGIVQETDTKQNLLPGYGFVNETFSSGGGGSLIKSLNGLAIASVKSRNGLAIASIKSINGLSNV